MSDPRSVRRRAEEGYRWEGVDELPYKEDEQARFRSVSRQVLFRDPALAGELRYFEVAPDGFTSLERHAHMHAVLILRGAGRCLVGNEIKSIRRHDLITVPPWAWHQFRATGTEPLGFLCLVNATRDAPQVASDENLAVLRREPQIAAFLRGETS
jgi:mannose-6-phosphate isomerase-like protein (cupin superfamily)